ncbi:MAG: hypothetical protein HUK18_00280, partial [Bacteroidales bacterium]|nr:hypothetical protein [Bacteroidales bacterium]
MKKNLLLGSIVLLLCTLCIPFNSFAQFEKISIFRDLGTDTPTIQKPAQQNAVAINGPKATFTFSGGDGTTGNPYQISTAKDLVDLASAVNSLSKNSNGLSYASANYIMTDNIDMGEMVEGPFIICTQVIQSSNSSTKNQFILKASQNADGSYTCDPVALDNQTSSTNTHPITLANKTSTITNTKTGASGQYPPSGYTATFTYEFQGDKPLSISALSSPIGFLGVDSRNYVDNKISIPFKGTFDGNGYTISNFTMISENIATGLFGYIEGTIQNLAMTNVSIENPNSDYSGAIVGVAGGNVNSNPHTYSYIINCMVTNSNINGYYAGGIAGVLVNLDDIDQSYIQNCRAYNNDIVGSIGAPILGSGPHGNQHVEDNTAYNNNIAANYSGAIIGGTSTAKDVYDSNQNVDLGSPSSSINDFINGLLAGKIPDFCYINSGFMFDQNNIIDARILATLKNELDGTEPITQNLVLPNISAFTAAINNPQIIYANTITWSIYPPANTTTGGNGNDYWSVTAQIANGNIYTMNNNNQFSQYTGNLTYIPARKNNSPIKYYYKININGTDKYYPYYYTEQ